MDEEQKKLCIELDDYLCNLTANYFVKGLNPKYALLPLAKIISNIFRLKKDDTLYEKILDAVGDYQKEHTESSGKVYKPNSTNSDT